MANTIKLYKVTCVEGEDIRDTGTRYSLYPWPGDGWDTVGYDDGGHDYALPEGYTLGETTMGEPAIFAPGDNIAATIVTEHNHPVIVTANETYTLKRA